MIQQMSANDVNAYWEQLRPMLTVACEANEIAATELTADDIYTLTQIDTALILADIVDGKILCFIVLQFTDTNGHKGADIIAMAGKKLMSYVGSIWEDIVKWIKSNGIEHIDVHTYPKLARILSRKFGFTKSCIYLRRVL